MSSPQTTQPMQIHPMAELRETLFQAGMLRQRNLVLAQETYTLQERVKQLEAEVEALTAPTSSASSQGALA